MGKRKCYYRIERLLKDMKHHGFVDQDDRRYWFDQIMYLNDYVRMGEWDACLRQAKLVEDRYFEGVYSRKFNRQAA